MSLPICRVCMDTSLEYIDFESPFENNGDATYMESFNQCTKLNASYFDNLPKNLCSDCGVQLKIACNFIKKAEESDRIFKMQLYYTSKPESNSDQTNMHALNEDSLNATNLESKTIINNVDENVEILYEYEDNSNLQIQKSNTYSPDSNDWIYMCNICNISFLSESSFKLHNKQHHIDDVKEEINLDYDTVIPYSETKSIANQFEPDNNVQQEKLDVNPNLVSLKCDKCDKYFNSTLRLGYHQNWHNGIRPYSCPHCKNSYFSKIILNLHIKRVHSNTTVKEYKQIKSEAPQSGIQTSQIEIEYHEDESLNDFSIKCDECNKSFSTHILLARHKKNIHNKKVALFLCSSCPKTFKNSSLLRNHEKTHTNREIKFTCEHCGKGFFMRSSYKSHLKIHNPDRPKYTCKICNRNFSFPTGLNMHMKIHEGGNFECMQCGKRFVRNNDLTVHIRFHTGDYPFQCSECNKRFAIKSHLKEHLARHSGIKVKCNLCDAEFINKSTLRSHMYIHSEMPFICTHCDKGFNSRYKIKRHILHVHKIPVSEDEFDQLFPKRNVIHEKNINLDDESQISNNI